jgi:hypothetical protein
MVADKSKKLKLSDNTEEIDGELVLSVEKLQEIQDELEKVPKFHSIFFFSFNFAKLKLLMVVLNASGVFNLMHSVPVVNQK